MIEILDPHDKSLSRTKRKEASQALQKLGRDIAELPKDIFNALALDKDLHTEIERLRNTTSHVARKRQMQFVGKLLRRENAEPLFIALQEYQQRGRDQVARQHRVEHWRDYLLSNGDAGLTQLVNAVPTTDRQAVRQLIRQATREAQQQKPPAASRKLFRLLHQQDLQQALPDAP